MAELPIRVTNHSDRCLYVRMQPAPWIKDLSTCTLGSKLGERPSALLLDEYAKFERIYTGSSFDFQAHCNAQVYLGLLCKHNAELLQIWAVYQVRPGTYITIADSQEAFLVSVVEALVIDLLDEPASFQPQEK
jgi:hypothetical protein